MRRSVTALSAIALAATQLTTLPLAGAAPAAARSQIRCSADGGRQRTFCPADTDNRVELRQDLSGGGCRAGRTWGYDARSIWVSRTCSGLFAYGDGGGVSTGAVVGGLAVAGILAAILASGGKDRNQQGYGPNDPYPGDNYDYGDYQPGYNQGDISFATDVSQIGPLKSDALATCLNEALQQTERRGQGRLQLDRINSFVKRGTQHYVLDADVTVFERRRARDSRIRCETRYNRIVRFDVV